MPPPPAEAPPPDVAPLPTAGVAAIIAGGLGGGGRDRADPPELGGGGLVGPVADAELGIGADAEDAPGVPGVAGDAAVGGAVAYAVVVLACSRRRPLDGTAAMMPTDDSSGADHRVRHSRHRCVELAASRAAITLSFSFLN